MASEDNSPHQPGDAQTLIQRAALVWAQARDATSSEARIELERLALLYERMAVRAARREQHRSTLGDLLYRDSAKSRVTEAQWVALLSGAAKRHPKAFRTLFLWTHRLVFSLIMQITHEWRAAEKLTLDVFDAMWREADQFEPLRDTVLGWVMATARCKALEYMLMNPHPNPNVVPVPELMLNWAADALPFSVPLWMRITERITMDTDETPLQNAAGIHDEPDWEQPAPGIFCKLLSTDTERGRVSMLVRLSPQCEYPPHMHAGVEQLHLLQGTLWINDRKLGPGDYNQAEAGTADRRVWSETGCTCILITSSRDIIS